MKALAPLLALVPLAACDPAVTPPAAPAAQPQSAANPVPAVCPLTIEFGSYAMGIDRPTFERVEALLARDAAVTNVDRRRWGREGEVTLCVSVRSAADRDRLFTAIAALVPPRPLGPVSVTTDAGRVFRANNDQP